MIHVKCAQGGFGEGLRAKANVTRSRSEHAWLHKHKSKRKYKQIWRKYRLQQCVCVFYIIALIVQRTVASQTENKHKFMSDEQLQPILRPAGHIWLIRCPLTVYHEVNGKLGIKHN